VGFPSYKAIAKLPLEERTRRLRDPGVRARLLEERSEPVAGDDSPVPPLADQLLAHLDQLCARLFPFAEVPDYEPPVEASVAARARAEQKRPLEAVLDALLEEEGRALLYFPLFNYSAFDLEHLRQMLDHPLALLGLGDGGAHVGTICDASFPTTLLTHWCETGAGALASGWSARWRC
jgi:N-acyl-D-aspartate/D-glutamate deacylase